MTTSDPQRDPALETTLMPYLDGSIARKLVAFQSVASTMDTAAALAASGAPEGTLIFAARQEQGKGRQGRAWASPEGGVYLSLILRPERPAAEIPQLSLVAGLAAAEAIQEVAGVLPTIRWPNDILMDDLKVAGILVEAKSGAVIVGVGINVTANPDELPETATTLSIASGEWPNPYQVAGALCRRFSAWYEVWRRQGLAPIRAALRPRMGLFGQVVHITAGSSEFEGTATDLDESGRLVVRLDSGLQRTFDMGEVTLLR